MPDLIDQATPLASGGTAVADTADAVATTQAEDFLRQSGVLHEIELDGFRAGMSQALEEAGIETFQIRMQRDCFVRLQLVAPRELQQEDSSAMRLWFYRLFRRAGYAVRPGNLRVSAEKSGLEVYALPTWEGM